jgi:hypothetical protein
VEVDGRATVLEVEITDDESYWDAYKTDRQLVDTEEEWQVVWYLRRARAGAKLALPIEVLCPPRN